MTNPNEFPASPDPTLTRRLQFLLLADQLKGVERRTFVSDASRHENSAEHSWHLALAVILFAPYAREKNLDLTRALQMALVHDLVEVEAGDTYVYDAVATAGQTEREQRAADAVFGVLPAAQTAQFRGLWDEFEALGSPEARFVRALDRMLPLLLNFVTDGKAWIEHQIRVDQVQNLNLPAMESVPELREYCAELIEEAQKRGFLRAAPAR